MYGRPYTIKKAILILIVLSAILLAYAPAAHAASTPLVVVESFKEDKVRLDIGDTTHVTRTLVIQNMIDKPIVPGMITLVLQKQAPDRLGPISIPFTASVRPVNVTDVKARLADGTAITDVRVNESGNATTIQYGAWAPIEPNQTLTVVLEYDSPDIVEKGLFFNTVQYPFTSSSIPVEKAIVETAIGSGRVTYASETPAQADNVYTWEKAGLGMGTWAVAFEYSILPLPILPISGGALFWGLVLLLCLLWVAWTYTRPRKKP